VLQVAAPLKGRNDILARLGRILGAVTVLLGLATFGGGWWLARRMVKPVSEIIDQAESIEAQTLDRRIDAHADLREYERLVGVLNTMLGRLNRAFEAQRRFTADASHELRGPLTALRGEVELALRRERDPEEYRRVLASSLEEVERLSRLAEDLLTLARSDAGVMEPRLQPTDVLERTERVRGRLAQKAAAKNVTLTVDARGAAEAMVDPGLLDQLLWNLMDNAVKFTPAGGRVEVTIEGPDPREDDGLTIRVADTGPGLPPDQLDRIFERFFRVDEARTHDDEPGGTGLGLSIVRAIVDIHGGRAEARNRAEGGAEFIVTLRGGAE
jgi:two-component system OmpR family sensor kinase